MMNEEFARSVKNSLRGFFILREALFFILHFSARLRAYISRMYSGSTSTSCGV